MLRTEQPRHDRVGTEMPHVCAVAASVRSVNDESADPHQLKRGFSREQAAGYCGVSIYKVAIAVRQNTLPARRHGKYLIVFREELDAWMDGWEIA